MIQAQIKMSILVCPSQFPHLVSSTQERKSHGATRGRVNDDRISPTLKRDVELQTAFQRQIS